MVCQAASQTRFRALKHENGIAGSATIIVRVIACFQPLQDCQAFTPVPNSILKQNPPLTTYGNPGEAVLPNADIGHARKRFVVFDQSGDQTTMIFSSALGTSIQQLATWRPKSSVAHNLIPEQGGARKDMFYHSQKDMFVDESDENQGVDSKSEMHEDTEELNALLYSDDETESNHDENDEETSTGHSPSTMTAHEELEGFEEEEVASSAGATKRRKLSDGSYDVPSLMDTATSAKTKRSLECEDDAESSCGNVNDQGSQEMVFLSGNKSSRKERIRETVTILQSIIPGGEGKDAIVVLDKAINYLKSLKFKAESLGMNTLEF
ncbi:hypothetical protein RJ641_029756 [Dillenia turbinata]|uniref:BHLH domain-containing protein n=1 Tax=Dillenia turbinata TaxID=194707 RepID=A0AAN8VUC9_9MAGN